MKKLLFTFAILAAALSSCDCKHGYGPNDCKETWASNYTGTWNASLSCPDQFTTFTSAITEESATSIRIDGDIYARLDDWNRFTIPQQNFGNGSITGSGTLTETHQTQPNGAIIVTTRRINFSFDVTVNGQYQGTCSATYLE